MATLEDPTTATCKHTPLQGHTLSSNGDDVKPPTPKTKMHSLVNKVKDIHTSTRYYIEDPAIVVFFLLLVYADIVLGSFVLSGDSSSSDSSNVLLQNLHTILLSVQAFELVLQMILFHTRFFSHWGYLLDTILIGTRLLNEYGGYEYDQRNLHLYSYLRVWRFFRAAQAFTTIEVTMHNNTKEKLFSQTKSTKEWKNKATTYKDDVAREKKISKEFREEIDTLTEALQLAAQDVARYRTNGIAEGRDEIVATGTGRVSPVDNEDGDIPSNLEALTEDSL